MNTRSTFKSLLLLSLIFDLSIATASTPLLDGDKLDVAYSVIKGLNTDLCNWPIREEKGFDAFFSQSRRSSTDWEKQRRDRCMETDRVVVESSKFLDWKRRRELRKANILSLIKTNLLVNSSLNELGKAQYTQPTATSSYGVSLDFERVGLKISLPGESKLNINVVICSPPEFSSANIKAPISLAFDSIRTALNANSDQQKGKIPLGFFDYQEQFTYLMPEATRRLTEQRSKYHVFITEKLFGRVNQQIQDRTISVLDDCVFASVTRRRGKTATQIGDAISRINPVHTATMTTSRKRPQHRRDNSAENFKRDMDRRIFEMQIQRIKQKVDRAPPNIETKPH